MARDFALAHGDVVDDITGEFLADVRLRGGGWAAFGWFVGVRDGLLGRDDLGYEAGIYFDGEEAGSGKGARGEGRSEVCGGCEAREAEEFGRHCGYEVMLGRC